MKRVVCLTVLVAVVGLILYSFGRENPLPLAEAVQSGEIVRLHVIASGDGAYEQETKLAVRDSVLALCGPALEESKSAAESADILRGLLPQIEKAASETAKSRGEKGEASASFGEYDFPDKTYAGVLVPAGKYQALRVVLGDGRGANWWCVMYPPLCFIGEEAVEPGEKIEVKFESSIAKWFKKLRSK